MAYSYLLHPEADKEYTEAFIWYEERQEGLGERFIEAVRQKLNQSHKTRKFIVESKKPVIAR